MAGLAYRRGECIESHDVRADERFTPNPRETRIFHSLVAVPLRIGDRVVGVLSVVSTKIGAFSPSDVSFIKILAALLEVILSLEEDEQRMIEALAASEGPAEQEPPE